MTFLPCPVCGSEHIYDAGLWRHVIKCHTCGLRTRSTPDWSEAVDLWNTRSLTPAQNHADELLDCLQAGAHHPKPQPRGLFRLAHPGQLHPLRATAQDGNARICQRDMGDERRHPTTYRL